MKIALIGDSHFGARNDSVFFMDRQKEYYENHFFPYLLKNKIDTIIHLGDLFDKRKQINFASLAHTKDCFINPIIKFGLKLHLIVGNHDSYYKSTGELVSSKLLFDYVPEENLIIYDKIQTVEFGNKTFLMVPWIFPKEKDAILEVIRLSHADICCGHFEMIGVAYQGSVISRVGIEPDSFKGFEHTFSGHFHKPSAYYVGSPYQLTWNDYGDDKRIIVYDTETNDKVDVNLGNDIFVKIIYNGQDFDSSEDYNNKIVRVVVKSKDSIPHFDKFILDLESQHPYEIDVKDEYLYIKIINEENNGEDEKGTLDILLESVDLIEELKDGEKVVVKEIMKQLYIKATE